MHNTARQRLVKADTNYGVVGDNTVRTAAQIGNATGPADFNVGPATNQTVRIALAEGSSIGLTPVETGVNTFGSVPALPTVTETVVVTYTTVAKHFLLRASASGCADGIFTLKVDGAIIARKRNAWTERNVEFEFGRNGLVVPVGKVIEITAYNYGEGPQQFDGNIYGEEP